jgi:syntaxin 1B/2/3
MNSVNTLAHKVKNKLEVLDRDSEAAKKVKGQGVGSASERTRTTITAGLKKKLKDIMGEFSDLRNRIQEEYREIVERRVYTITGTKRAGKGRGGWVQVGTSRGTDPHSRFDGEGLMAMGGLAGG